MSDSYRTMTDIEQMQCAIGDLTRALHVLYVQRMDQEKSPDFERDDDFDVLESTVSKLAEAKENAEYLLRRWNG